MNIPGAAIQHCIITRDCRNNRGDGGAFDEAVERLRKAYDQQLDNLQSPDMELHIALVVQFDRHRKQET